MDDSEEEIETRNMKGRQISISKLRRCQLGYGDPTVLKGRNLKQSMISQISDSPTDDIFLV